MDHALDEQVCQQDHQRDHRCAFQLHLGLELGDHQRHRLITRGGEEGDGGDGHHAVDEEVRAHFQQCVLALGDQHIPHEERPLNAHGVGHALQIFVDLGQGVVDHQIGRGNKVHHIHQNQHDDGAVDGGLVESQHIGKTQYHAGDGGGGHGRQVQEPGEPGLHAGGEIGRHEGDAHAQHGGAQGDDDRVEVVFAGAQPEGPDYIGQGKGEVVGIVGGEGQHHEGDQRQQRQYGDEGAPAVGGGVDPLAAGDLTGLGDKAGVAAILVEYVDDKGDHGGDQQHRAVHGALAEVQLADDLLVHDGGNGGILAAHHQRHAVVGDDQREDGEHHADQRLTQKGQHDGGELAELADTQHPGGLVSRAVLIVQHIREHQVGHGEGVQHGAHHNTLQTVDTALQAEKAGQKAVVAQQDHKAHTVGDGGQQHGQHEDDGKEAFQADVGAFNAQSQQKGDGHGDQRADQRRDDRVEHRLSKDGGGHHAPDALAVHVAEHAYQRDKDHGHKHQRQKKLDEFRLAQLVSSNFDRTCHVQPLTHFMRESILICRFFSTKFSTYSSAGWSTMFSGVSSCTTLASRMIMMRSDMAKASS